MSFAKELNDAMIRACPDIVEEDPVTWAHCLDCHGDNYETAKTNC